MSLFSTDQYCIRGDQYPARRTAEAFDFLSPTYLSPDSTTRGSGPASDWTGGNVAGNAAASDVFGKPNLRAKQDMIT